MNDEILCSVHSNQILNVKGTGMWLSTLYFLLWDTLVGHMTFRNGFKAKVQD